MAFPTTTVLDAFNRADEGPPPSAAWTDILNGVEVISNEAAGDIASGNLSYLNGQTYGPDSEAFVTIAVKPGVGNGIRVFVRLADVGSSSTYDGYCVAAVEQSGTDRILIQRVTNGAFTTLVNTSQEFNVGDGIGIEVIGSTIRSLRDSGGGYVEVANTTDSDHTAAGYIGLGVQNTTGRADDFGGGTVASGETVTPGAASVGLAAIDPTAVQSSLAIAPAAAAAQLTAVDPAVAIGGGSIIPKAAEVLLLAIDPTAVQSSLAIVPAAAPVQLTAVDPTVPSASLTVSPAAAQLQLQAADPAVIILMAIVLTLRARSATVELPARSFVLVLRLRPFDLTVEEWT